MIEWYTDEASEHRWRAVAEVEESEPELVNDSHEGFKTKGGAQNNLFVTYTMLSTFLVSVAKGKEFEPVEFYEDRDGKTRWRITSNNGEIVAASHKGFPSVGAAKGNLLMTYTLISTYLAMGAEMSDV